MSVYLGGGGDGSTMYFSKEDLLPILKLKKTPFSTPYTYAPISTKQL